MTVTGLAYGLPALVGAGIIVIGARFPLAARRRWLRLARRPRARVSGPYLTVKGIRDITCGLFVFILIATCQSRLLGWLILAATLISADSGIVIRHRGSKATACGVHRATAAFTLAKVLRPHSRPGGP